LRGLERRVRMSDGGGGFGSGNEMGKGEGERATR